MRRYILFLTVVLLAIPGRSQVFLKTAEDTAFVLDHVYFPQMQLKLTVNFITSDFSEGEKIALTLNDLDSIQALIEEEPDNGDHYLSLNAAFNEYHQTYDADTSLRKAKDLYLADMMKNPADTHAIRQLAGIYLGQMDWQLAYAYYQEFTRLAPESPEGWTGLAMISMAGYDYDVAVEHMEKAIQADPACLNSYCQMANIMMMKSISDLSLVDSAGFDSLNYKNLINVDFLNAAVRKMPERTSLEAMRDALVLSSILYQAFIENSEKITGRGDSIHFVIDQECTQALAEIEKRMLALVNGKYKTKIFTYNCLMLIELLRNEPEKALQWFEKGIVYNPRSQNLYENMTGICALGMKRECAFNLQLRLDSIHPTFNNMMMTAYFYYLDKNFDQAMFWTKRMMETQNRSFYSQMCMAVLLTRQMKFNEATIYLDRAAGINPDHPDVKLLTAILYLFDNSPFMAKSALNQLQAGEGAMPEAQELLDRFWP